MGSTQQSSSITTAFGWTLNRTLLCTHRALRKLSQTEAAAGIGIDRSHLAHLENGSRQPSYDLLERIAIYFELPLNSLIAPADADATIAAMRPAKPKARKTKAAAKV